MKLQYFKRAVDEIAEIFTGLELLKAASCYTQQELFCWQRSADPGSAHC